MSTQTDTADDPADGELIKLDTSGRLVVPKAVREQHFDEEPVYFRLVECDVDGLRYERVTIGG